MKKNIIFSLIFFGAISILMGINTSAKIAYADDYTDPDAFTMTDPSSDSCTSCAEVSLNLTLPTSTTPSYAIGGTASDFSSGTLTLQNNGGDDLAISVSGSFVFATHLADKATYNVVITGNSTDKTCSVTNGSGTIAGSAVNNISVTCVTKSSGGSSGSGGGGGGSSGGGGGSSVKKDTTPPSTPTGLTVSSTAGKVVLAWTNPTNSDFSGVKLYRKLGSAATSTADSAAVLIFQGKGTGITDSGVLSGLTYYYSLYAYDTSSNYSSAAVVLISISATGQTSTSTSVSNQNEKSTSTTSTGGSATVKASSTTITSLIGATSATVNQVTADESQKLIANAGFVSLTSAETVIYKKIIALTAETITDATKFTIADFIHSGTPTTLTLGAGERAGSIASFQSAFGRLPNSTLDWQDVVKIGNGRWTTQTSASAEAKAKISFKKIYLREPNMKQANDNAAVNIMAYGLRPASRNTASEKTAILSFKYIFKKTPVSAEEWDIVRAIAYSGAKR
jgi:hypothetical protein